MSFRSILAAVLAAAALLLAGCGEKDEPETAGPVVPQSATGTDAGSTTAEEATTTEQDGDQGQASAETLIRASIVEFLAGSDPALVCGEILTESFLRKAYGDRQGCLEGRRPGSLAASQQIGDVRVMDSTASAVARAEGGVYDGQRLAVELVAADESWQIDSIDANVPVGP